MLNRVDIYALVLYETWPGVRKHTHTHSLTHSPRVEEHKSSSSGTDTPISHRSICCQTLGPLISASPLIVLQPWASVTRDTHALFVICLVVSLGSSRLVARSVSAHACELGIKQMTLQLSPAAGNEIMVMSSSVGLNKKGNTKNEDYQVDKSKWMQNLQTVNSNYKFMIH